uniref:DUF295 domain-containing protein n=1 Tax=Oryza punctata TaxID=4537 RepID=A0A0E0MG27_ORYPU
MLQRVYKPDKEMLTASRSASTAAAAASPSRAPGTRRGRASRWAGSTWSPMSTTASSSVWSTSTAASTRRATTARCCASPFRRRAAAAATARRRPRRGWRSLRTGRTGNTGPCGDRGGGSPRRLRTLAGVRRDRELPEPLGRRQVPLRVLVGRRAAVLALGQELRRPRAVPRTAFFADAWIMPWCAGDCIYLTDDDESVVAGKNITVRCYDMRSRKLYFVQDDGSKVAMAPPVWVMPFHE